MERFSRLAGQAISLVLPPRCPACGVIVASDHTLCAPCWQSLDFLTGLGCARCGTPLPDAAMVCAPCLADPPDHDGVRAAVVYGDVARSIVLRLKHGGQIGLADTIASALVRWMPPRHAATSALLVPVPLHRWRIWHRGFNQAALIAAKLARHTGHVVSSDALLRTRATAMLRGRGTRERAATVRGAFALNPARASAVRGRDIWLIDDVYTSGATANACARVLKRGGAASVTVLCWARVLRETDEAN